MRIGIDGRLLAGQKSGARTYLLEVLDVWSATQPDSEFYIFTNREVNHGLRTSHRFRVVHVRCKSGFMWVQSVLPRLLRKHSIDVYWGPNYALPLFGPRSIRYVITIHDMVSYVMPQTLPLRTVLHNRLLMPWYLKRADLVIAVSKYTRHDIIRYTSFPPSSIRVVYHGVNSRFETPLESTEKKYHLNAPYILVVGAIEPRKNLVRVLRAFFRLCEDEDCEHDLLIVGPYGWKGKEVYETAKRYSRFQERVKFLGQVPDEDLATLYKHASVFLYPSLYEGFGLPVIEAMRAGTPVITSDNSSLGEITGNAALLVPPRETDKIYKCLRQVIFDDTVCKRLRLAGKRRSMQFNWSNTADKTLEVLREAGRGKG